LSEGTHRDSVGYRIGPQGLVVALKHGATATLEHGTALAGYQGATEAPAVVLLVHHGLHVELHLDRAHPIGREDPAGVSDVVLESAVTTIQDCEDSVAAVDAAVGRGLLGSGREQLTARIGELETSRAKVMDAAETERMRIERDLHDGAQQRLVSLAMDLGRAKAKFGTDPEAAAAIVSEAHEQAKEALVELRNLVRGVHPPVLSDRGLDAALSGLAALSPVPVTVSVELPARPPAAIEAIAYFVVAEALTNIAKHAHAHHARVLVVGVGDQLSVEITDDGVGGADPAGQGLSGLAARVAGVDGQFRVTSPAGGPTTLEVTLPCGS